MGMYNHCYPKLVIIIHYYHHLFRNSFALEEVEAIFSEKKSSINKKMTNSLSRNTLQALLPVLQKNFCNRTV